MYWWYQEWDQNANNRGWGRDQVRGHGRGVQYQFCGKNGHIASACYKLKSLLFESSSSQLQQKSSSSTCVSLGNGNFDKSWILNTKETHHLTNDATNLRNPTPFAGNDGVLIVNGTSLPISHFGSFFHNIQNQYLIFLMSCTH